MSDARERIVDSSGLMLRRMNVAGVIGLLFAVPFIGARFLPDRITGIESQVVATGVCLAAAALALNL